MLLECFADLEAHVRFATSLAQRCRRSTVWPLARGAQCRHRLFDRRKDPLRGAPAFDQRIPEGFAIGMPGHLCQEVERIGIRSLGRFRRLG